MTLDNNLLKKIENFKRHVLKSIPLPSTNTPSTDSTNGSTGSSLEYARSDHQHPKSTLYAESVHSHNDMLSDLLDDINNTTVVVDSPNPIGQDGDTILLRGRMYGDDVSGKSIDYYIGNTLIGSSVTNSNGVSFLNYECDGLGVRNVTAKNGSIVSETLSVLDTLFYDDGISDSISNYYINSPTNLTRTVAQDGTGTELENIHQSNTYYDRAIKVDTPTPSSLSDSKVFTGDLYIEFEKVSQTGTGTGIPSFQVGGFSRFLSNYSEGIIKFTVEDGKIYRYGTDDTKVDTGITVTGAYEVGFIVPASAKIKYKNWKIYPI